MHTTVRLSLFEGGSVAQVEGTIVGRTVDNAARTLYDVMVDCHVIANQPAERIEVVEIAGAA